MRKQTHIHKLTRILGFWILFFALVVLTVSSEALGINKTYITMFFGILLIGNYVPYIKGEIKRRFYFFGLLALLFMLAILRKIFGIQPSPNFLMVFFNIIFYFTISYFFMSALYIMPITMKVLNLAQSTLGLEIQSNFIRTLILCLLFLGVFYPFVILNIKRLRDINLSGWFSLITFIPFISILFEIFLCFKGSVRKKSS